MAFSIFLVHCFPTTENRLGYSFWIHVGSYKKVVCSNLIFITMAVLHGIVRPIKILTEFDGSDEDVVPRQKPKTIFDQYHKVEFVRLEFVWRCSNAPFTYWRLNGMKRARLFQNYSLGYLITSTFHTYTWQKLTQNLFNNKNTTE